MPKLFPPIDQISGRQTVDRQGPGRNYRIVEVVFIPVRPTRRGESHL